MNKTQIQTTLAPLIGVIAGFLAGKNVFGFDAATWSTLIGSVVGTGVIIWGAVATRKISMADTLGEMPGTTVVTDKRTADALPNNDSVVSNSEVSIVKK